MNLHKHINLHTSSVSRLAGFFSSIFICSISFGSFFTTGCNAPASSNAESNISKRAFAEEANMVDTAHVIHGVFNKELISNGKLQAIRQADLHFKLSEDILSIPVKNGQRVRKGQLLAELEPFTQQTQLELAQQNRNKAHIDMQDALIGYGYKLADSAQIPETILKNARTKSGYLQAQSELSIARRNLSHTRLFAPFSGIIANLETRPFNQADPARPFCTLISDREFEVVFAVLESEMAALQQGRAIEISPFALKEKTYNGHISSINPVIDDNGMIQVNARVSNNDRSLIAGMNVRVLLKTMVPDQLIIPKSAVVLRQGREVVFTVVRDTAIWNYVEIGLENSRQFSISQGLEAGAAVVTEGNLNLAHKVKVIVR